MKTVIVDPKDDKKIILYPESDRPVKIDRFNAERWDLSWPGWWCDGPEPRRSELDS